MTKIENIRLNDGGYKSLLLAFSTVFWPVLFTFLITAILGIVDTIMISRYDPDAVLGVKSILAFSQTISPMFWAIITGIGIFSVKFVGTDDHIKLKNTFGLQIIVAIFYGVIGFTLETIFSTEIISVFIDKSENPESFYYAKDFAKFYRWNFLFYPINLVFTYQYRYKKKSRLAFVISTSLILTNLFLNWIFIFKLDMGVSGASLGTLVSNIIFIIVNIVIAKTCKMDFIGNFKNSIIISRELLKEIAIITLPIFISESLFSAGRYMYSYGFSLASTNSFVTDRVAYQMMAIPNAFIMAGATAVSVIISYEISNRKSREEIVKVSKMLFRVMGLISFVALLVSIIILPRLTNIYGIPEDTYHEKLIFFIRVNGVFLLFKGFAYTALFIIRTGGDVKYGVYVDIITTWFIGIPFIFLGATMFGVSGQALKVIQLFDIIVHAILIVRRYKKYHWLKDV